MLSPSFYLLHILEFFQIRGIKNTSTIHIVQKIQSQIAAHHYLIILFLDPDSNVC